MAKSKLDLFVSEFGVEELARRLDVNPSAIYHWLRGRTVPRFRNQLKIQRLAKQRGVLLSINEIADHCEVRSKRYRASSLKPEPACA